MLSMGMNLIYNKNNHYSTSVFMYISLIRLKSLKESMTSIITRRLKNILLIAITEKRHIKDNFRKPEPVEVKKGSDKVDDTLSRFKSLRAQMGEKNLSSVLEKESTLSRVQSLRAKLDSKSQEESKPVSYSKLYILIYSNSA